MYRCNKQAVDECTVCMTNIKTADTVMTDVVEQMCVANVYDDKFNSASDEDICHIRVHDLQATLRSLPNNRLQRNICSCNMTALVNHPRQVLQITSTRWSRGNHFIVRARKYDFSIQSAPSCYHRILIVAFSLMTEFILVQKVRRVRLRVGTCCL
jgi:hypothetical protein